MKNKMLVKTLKLCAIFLFGFSLTGLKAQEAVSSSGGNATGTGGSASYTIGQVAYLSNSSSTGKITQGVQQPYEIFLITTFEDANGISLICSVYPNPTLGFLTLKIESNLRPQFIASLYDINGKVLEKIQILSKETNINLSNIFPSTYFLKITQNNKEIKTFKIIKN